MKKLAYLGVFIVVAALTYWITAQGTYITVVRQQAILDDDPRYQAEMHIRHKFSNPEICVDLAETVFMYYLTLMLEKSIDTGGAYWPSDHFVLDLVNRRIDQNDDTCSGTDVQSFDLIIQKGTFI
jgi:hypothetical protein